ncbi:tetratricopeptide repeat protein [Tumebacillus sp. BK434]|uniref:helix-turn-helix domain-containing protein n=1 Tax=Tumebacillus sp. BK434 TaxID=2512169 RepID=UPI00104327E5|nr:helix-turn-helix domain-containing protein [Tumebacillus sp. BK434]TCP57778.1 tetratricopeptide repeat protein [Tumebacillus sp. BK434]
MNTLGDKIRELRLRKGITQIELAAGLCTPSMISQVESNRARPSYKMLYGLALKLETPLENLLKDVELDLEQASQFKMALSMTKAKAYGAALPLLERLAESALTKVSPSKVEFELAKCYMETGEYEKSSLLFNKMADAASLRQEQDLVAQVLLQLADLSNRKKEYQIAKHHGYKALDAMRSLDAHDPFLYAQILTQLAEIHENIGEVKIASDLYETALEISEGLHNLKEKAKTYLGLAESFYRQNDFEKAAEYAERSSSAIGELSDQHTLLAWKQKLLMLQRSKGNRQQTVDELLSIASILEANQEKEEAGAVLLDAATIQVENGALQEAETCLEKAKQLLPPHHAAMGTYFRLLAGLHFSKEHHEQGDKALEKSIRIFMNHAMLAELREAVNERCERLNQQGLIQEAFEQMKSLDEYLIHALHERGIAL